MNWKDILAVCIGIAIILLGFGGCVYLVGH